MGYLGIWQEAFSYCFLSWCFSTLLPSPNHQGNVHPHAWVQPNCHFPVAFPTLSHTQSYYTELVIPLDVSLKHITLYHSIYIDIVFIYLILQYLCVSSIYNL